MGPGAAPLPVLFPVSFPVPFPVSFPVLLPVLLPLLCGLQRGAARELPAPPHKIAVIGAGIGGTSAAYYLRQKFGQDVQIDVFEKGDVGGRLATLTMEGQEYEAGGSVIHPLNLHMKRFVKELGLSVSPGAGGLVGIYNGETFVFEESSWYIVTVVKILWQYGLQFLRMHMWVEDILDKFMRVYRYQAHDYAFSSVEGLLHALGGDEFTRLLNGTVLEALQKAGFSHKYLHDIVTPAMRVNYGQSANVNGFVGAVSLAGAESGLWSVEGGNKLVCSGLLSASGARLLAGAVTAIERKAGSGPDGQALPSYRVAYETAGGPASDLYGLVVVAAPLNRRMANITFVNFSPPVPEFHKYYHQTVTTLVRGRLNASLFGRTAPGPFPLTEILTTDGPDLFINSVGAVTPVTGKRGAAPAEAPSAVWKVFSQEPLSEEQMNLLFASYDAVRERRWLAYPHYRPPEKCPPVILHDRLYYLSGIEWAASAMEMSAIAAHNAALLAYHRWYGNAEMIDQEGLYEKLRTEL
ncbi:prenylcysteine oxidase 1 [Tachyglossus aculeatus]|uniref:prenylcysteine oxidase 1 n=1 Tax=Tachyglossus aculeatus TaxID=9261 RepID=UPI0018F379F2|nr:prenylcysteine oxidase 1 [Tachyglossus aculeatus]